MDWEALFFSWYSGSFGPSSLIPLFEVYNYVNEIVFFTERFSFFILPGGLDGVFLDALVSVFFLIMVMLRLLRTRGAMMGHRVWLG